MAENNKLVPMWENVVFLYTSFVLKQVKHSVIKAPDIFQTYSPFSSFTLEKQNLNNLILTQKQKL